jgi:hypothetical protein
MKVNTTLLIPGLLLIALLIISWQADKSGRMGLYSADGTFPAAGHAAWEAPAGSFRSAGCCTDDIRSAVWNGRTLELYTGGEPIRLFLSAGARTSDHFVPGASDVLGSVAACGRVWLPETRHMRLLEVTSRGEYNSEVGSNLVGSVNGIAVVSTQPLTLVLTTGPRDSTDEFLVQPARASGSNTEKLYLSRAGHSSPALVQVNLDASSSPVPLNIGEELWAPSGIAASSDGQSLFVVDERPDELAWLRVNRTNKLDAPWASAGKIARFPLRGGTPRGISRGLVVLRQGGQDVLAGAVPAGLAFVTTDGRRLGTIETTEPISRVLLGNHFGSPVLYVVAGRTIWEARLRNVTAPAEGTCSTQLAQYSK